MTPPAEVGSVWLETQGGRGVNHRVATGSDDGTARIWDTQSGAQLLTLAWSGLGHHIQFGRPIPRDSER